MGYKFAKPLKHLHWTFKDWLRSGSSSPLGLGQETYKEWAARVVATQAKAQLKEYQQKLMRLKQDCEKGIFDERENPNAGWSTRTINGVKHYTLGAISRETQMTREELILLEQTGVIPKAIRGQEGFHSRLYTVEQILLIKEFLGALREAARKDRKKERKCCKQKIDNGFIIARVKLSDGSLVEKELYTLPTLVLLAEVRLQVIRNWMEQGVLPVTDLKTSRGQNVYTRSQLEALTKAVKKLLRKDIHTPKELERIRKKVLTAWEEERTVGAVFMKQLDVVTLEAGKDYDFEVEGPDLEEQEQENPHVQERE